MVVPFCRGAVAAFAVALASCSAPAGPAFRGATDIDRVRRDESERSPGGGAR